MTWPTWDANAELLFVLRCQKGEVWRIASFFSLFSLERLIELYPKVENNYNANYVFSKYYLHEHLKFSNNENKRQNDANGTKI